MIRVGLTGGIGSGKSYVCSIFKALGVEVFSADDAGKKVMLNPEVMCQMIALLGKESYLNNQPNKVFIAHKIFSDSALLEQVNNIVHPKTLQLFYEWSLQFEGKMDYVITETALLWESIANQFVNYSIGVFCPIELSLKRLKSLTGFNEEDIFNRMKRQINPLLKYRLCDFQILNDDKNLIIPQILKIDEELRILAQKKSI
ncbi:MAG: dephospho-CoA kinase [Sediminibacterium sp.]|nr:dephospho-CoA kinase [Sediminibacterium sp.]